MNYKTKIALLIAIFLWASAFVGIRVSLTGYSPEGLALFRYLIASFFMAMIYFHSRRQKREQIEKSVLTIKDMIAMFLVGAFGIGVYNITLNYGELSISSGTASFIISQSPIVTAMIAIIFLGEQLNTVRVLGFIVSIIGIAFISMGETGGFKWDIGIFYVLLSAIAGGCYSVMQKPFLKKYNVVEATTYVIWGGTAFLLFYLPQLTHEIFQAPLQSTLMVIYLGIFPASVAYIAWSYALKEMPASQAVNFLYVMPFISTLLGWWYLNEVPMLLSFLGGLFALLGVWLVNQSYYLNKPISD